MNKFIVLGLVLLIAVSVFFTSHVVVPQKTEALPAWFFIQMPCCYYYAESCPDQVQYACFWDCMELSDCYNGY